VNQVVRRPRYQSRRRQSQARLRGWVSEAGLLVILRCCDAWSGSWVGPGAWPDGRVAGEMWTAVVPCTARGFAPSPTRMCFFPNCASNFVPVLHNCGARDMFPACRASRQTLCGSRHPARRFFPSHPASGSAATELPRSSPLLPATTPNRVGPQAYASRIPEDRQFFRPVEVQSAEWAAFKPHLWLRGRQVG
jgi:hypothetical protein